MPEICEPDRFGVTATNSPGAAFERLAPRFPPDQGF